MTALEVVLLFLLIQQPFGPVQFAVTETKAEHVVVEFHTSPPTVMKIDKDLKFEVLEGKLITDCEPTPDKKEI